MLQNLAAGRGLEISCMPYHKLGGRADVGTPPRRQVGNGAAALPRCVFGGGAAHRSTAQRSARVQDGGMRRETGWDRVGWRGTGRATLARTRAAHATQVQQRHCCSRSSASRAAALRRRAPAGAFSAGIAAGSTNSACARGSARTAATCALPGSSAHACACAGRQTNRETERERDTHQYGAAGAGAGVRDGELESSYLQLRGRRGRTWWRLPSVRGHHDQRLRQRQR